MKYEVCPVCGYDEMPYPPVPENICPSCGTQFGFDDHYHSPRELRSAWIDKNFPFFSDTRRPPKEWSPYQQLIIADHGADLIAHPRFRADLPYRSAVNKAFSEVRIAKQLRVNRDERHLTQAQLAEKAAMKQSRISELEGMNYSSWSISTLERLAEALGVGFKYAFVGWGELVPEIAGGLSPEALFVPSLETDRAFMDYQREELPPRAEDNQPDSSLTPYIEFLGRRSQSEVDKERRLRELKEREGIAQEESPLVKARRAGSER